MDFLDRKAALEEQIELEQDLLQTARGSRENLDQALRESAAELEERIAAGADQKELADLHRRNRGINDLMRETRQEIDDRRAYLDSLHERLDELHEEQLAVTQEAEARRLEAQAASKRSTWLESPLHPQNISRWIVTRGPRMLLVIAVAALLLFLIRISARGVARSVVHGGRGGEASSTTNRADTLALSFRSVASLLIVVAGTLLVFQEAGVDIKTVLGGAAILGFAIAFGAQNLMRDYFTGFMILLEDQYELGDLITIGSITGTVEKVNMRTTVLRDLEGRVHFIPNGEVKAVTNRTYVWGRAVLEIPVGYKEDVDRVMEVILDVAKNFRTDPEFESWVTDDPVMLGVDKFTEYGVVIKFMMKTRPDKMFAVRRQMLRRVKNRFDREGIEISVPHRVIIQREPDQAP
jgi:small conductance mechanosensitive channel